MNKSCPICKSRLMGIYSIYCSTNSTHYELVHNGFGDTIEKFWIAHPTVNHTFIFIEINHYANQMLIQYDKLRATINSIYYPSDNIQEFFMNLYIKYKKLLPFK